MTMIFQRVKTDGIAQLSYIIGDDDSQTAAVIDPRPNVDIYLKLAHRFGVAITHVFETHIHADFMSGARELAHRLGNAHLCASVEGNAQYGFDITPVRDGDTFDFGAVRLTARHTPGHTPEHLAYFVSEQGREHDPWGVFTGDSLFVGSAGRPDLLGDDETKHLADQLFTTLREIYLSLDDGCIIMPSHGAGSACGADIGDRPLSSIGYERRTNEFLEHDDPKEFSRFVRSTAPPEPHHYRRLKQLNSKGPPILRGLPPITPLPPEQFERAMNRGNRSVVDTRQMLAFGGGHIEGAINIGARPELSVWAGQMLDPEKPILLIVEHEPDLPWIAWHFVYTGFTNFAGYLAGGMRAWENSARPIRRLRQTHVDELHGQLRQTQLIDARAPDEWQQGHIPGATHTYVATMRDGSNLNTFHKDRPVTVYCDSGYRATIAASIL